MVRLSVAPVAPGLKSSDWSMKLMMVPFSGVNVKAFRKSVAEVELLVAPTMFFVSA